jgi:hypothetical protein
LGQALLGLLNGLGCKTIGTDGARNLCRVACFIELQRLFLVGLQVERIREPLILAAL